MSSYLKRGNSLLDQMVLNKQTKKDMINKFSTIIINNDLNLKDLYYTTEYTLPHVTNYND